MIISIIIIDMVRRTCSYLILCLRTINTGTIDITDVTATKHITITVGNTLFGAYLTAMDMYLGLAKHIAVGIKCTVLSITINIVTLTTAEHITQNMAIIHLYLRLTGLIKARQGAYGVGSTAGFNGTSSYGGNLTATMYAVADNTVPYLDRGLIDTTPDIIAATEHIAAVGQTRVIN